MSKLLSLIIASLLAVSSTTPLTHAQSIEGARQATGSFLQGLTEGVADELLFKQIQSIAAPACQLYALGVDFVNFFDRWNVTNSLVDITILFRNEQWRELIWAIDDRRDLIRQQLSRAERQRCTLAFALPELQVKNQSQNTAVVQARLALLSRDIGQLKATSEFLALQKRKMSFDKPRFYTYAPSPELPDGSLILRPLETDQIFYSLVETMPLKVNWEQFTRDSRNEISRLQADLKALLDTLPDTCFTVFNAIAEPLELFGYSMSRVADLNEKRSYSEFLREQTPALQREFGELCRPQEAQQTSLSAKKATSAEQQYQQFAVHLNSLITLYSQSVTDFESLILDLERQAQGRKLTTDEQKRLNDLLETKYRFAAGLEYYSLVLSKLITPATSSLSRILDRLSSLAEAITGLKRSSDGQVQSRLSLAKRFEKSKERTLQQMCSRIANMYRQAGRSTSDLPIIGSANGKIYCRAEPNCADVNVGNFIGGSEGRKKLWECSGFAFNGSELGPSQVTEDIIRRDSQDIAELLQQESLNELLKARDVHYQSLRSRYQALYQTSSDNTALLGKVIKDISTNLYDPNKKAAYDQQRTGPTSGSTHHNLLKRIYQDLYVFSSKQPGFCPAEENPVE